MKKRIISIALVLTMMLTLIPTVLAAGTTPTLTVSSATGNAGENETATISVTYNGNGKATSLRFNVLSELKVLSASSDYTFYFNEETNDMIIFDLDGIPSGEVACTFTFDLNVAAAKPSYEIALKIVDATDSTDEEFEIDFTPGTITIENAILIGDVTLDGKLSNSDLVQLARYRIGSKEFSDVQIKHADMNGDGRISNTDLVLLARALLAN